MALGSNAASIRLASVAARRMLILFAAFHVIIHTTAFAQLHDSVASRIVAPGVLYRSITRKEGPWRINVVEIDLRVPDLEIESARAFDQLRGRETTSSIAQRKNTGTKSVVAALNADFFDLKSGENENNQIIDGEFVKGVSVTESPHDTFENIHSQFAISYYKNPFIDRFAFAGFILWKDGSTHTLSSVNAISDSNGLSLFNHYYGNTTWSDTSGLPITEVALVNIGRRSDTLIFVAHDNPHGGGATFIPPSGAVVAGYRESHTLVERKISLGDTMRIVLALVPHRGKIKALVGGWPRIVLSGKNIAGAADTTEGTFPRFSANRHPRTGIGFSRDSTTLYFITVDGRQESSVGMSLIEFADLMISLGVHEGLNLDGGGSTTLVINGTVVNSPSDSTGERPVANCIFVTKILRNEH